MKNFTCVIYCMFVIFAIFTLPAVTAKQIGAYNIYNDGDVVGATARCSCGSSSYKYGTSYFVNYCPGCGKHGTLRFEEGAYSGNHYTSPEGLWYCTNCDRDYCAKCGKIHSSERYWLLRTNKPKIKVINETEVLKNESEKIEPVNTTLEYNLMGETKTLILKNDVANALGI